MSIFKKVKEIILNLVNNGSNLKKIRETLVKIFSCTETSIPNYSVIN